MIVQNFQESTKDPGESSTLIQVTSASAIFTCIGILLYIVSLMEFNVASTSLYRDTER